ncbi:MAG TPA: Ig-like domain-containing protein [Verrucomicrobiae bacterium]|nr:Ig-like domain-containing protein [Verrucomicrobiae bacterium]
MQIFRVRAVAWIILILVASLPSLAIAQPVGTNCPPQVSVTWPYPGTWWSDTFSLSTVLKIKAEATDPDGSVAQVRFFIETNLVGVATNPPFNIVWEVGTGGVPIDGGSWILKAVAIDDSGARSESNPVRIYYCIGCAPWPDLQIISPRNGTIFAAPATFGFSAEALASSSGEAGPVEFFVGTNSVGLVDAGARLTPTTPPSSVTVSNLPEGEYDLTVRFQTGGSYSCPCNRITNTIRVVRLGAQLPTLTPGGRLAFDVITSYPGRQTIIQASLNLLDWVPIATNRPSSNSFTFVDSSPATNAHRFYRVFIPP